MMLCFAVTACVLSGLVKTVQDSVFIILSAFTAVLACRGGGGGGGRVCIGDNTQRNNYTAQRLHIGRTMNKTALNASILAPGECTHTQSAPGQYCSLNCSKVHTML